MTFSTQPDFASFCRILDLSVAQRLALETRIEENKTEQEWQALYQDPQHTGFEALRRVKARQVLSELWLLYVAVNEQRELSIYTLHNWMLLLIQLADPKGSLQLTKLLMSNRQYALNRCVQTIKKAMRPVGLALPVALTLLSISNTVNASVKPEQAAANNANALSDVTGLLPVVMRQLSQGERMLGGLNTIDLVGSSVCSALSSTQAYTQALSFSTSVSLSLSFLNIVFSSLGCVTEGLSWRKSRQHSQCLETRLVQFQSLPTGQASDPDSASRDKTVLQKMLVLEKAKGADHKENTKLYGGLLAVALIASVVVNVVSFGAPIFLAIAALAINAVIAAVKLVCGLKTSHLTSGLKSLQSTDQSTSLFDRLHAVLEQKPLQLDFQKKITVSSAGFFKKTLSLQAYLENLLHDNPRKLTDIVTALERFDRAAFEKALNTHQQVGGWGDTLGMKLYRQLQASCAIVVPLDVDHPSASCAA